MQSIADHELTSELLQQNHYERISDEYDAHYNDPLSHQYMETFVFEPMFEGIDIAGKNVLEAMCGGGQATNYLLARNAKVTGLDISHQQIEHFKARHPNAETLEGSILDSGIERSSMDIVVVVGGVHHMPPFVNESIREIHRVLKPGGRFCFMEPHSESLVDSIRRAWYRWDPLFAKNEEAVNISDLHTEFSEHFDFTNEHYLGNFGYLFVLNSMVFRIPLWLKPIYGPSVLLLEKLFNKIGGKSLSCFVVGQWKKK